jgi:hypothetical protein
MVKLAGNEDIGTFTPDQLYAGEADIVTTQGVVASGQVCLEGQVMTRSGGQLFKYNKEGRAAGTLTFSGVGTAADTVTINGDVITLRAAADPALAEVTIGGTATATAQNMKAYINNHSDTLGVTASGAAAVLTLTAVEPGPVGNAITTTEAGTNTAFGAATLTGGSDDARPYCVLPHDIDTSAAGLNADSDSPIIIGGVLNFDKLIADGASYADLQDAFAFGNSNIVVQKLY